MGFVIVRSPGHFVHVGEMDYMDEKEIRLINARMVRRFTNDPIGLTKSTTGAVLNDTRASVRISNGPGVFVYDADDGVWK